MTLEMVLHAHVHLEDGSGHKKMRVEPINMLQRKAPLKQRRSYFDSAEYFLDQQGLQPRDTPLIAGNPAELAPNNNNVAHITLPMKLQPCQHVVLPSRLSVRT